MQSGDECLIDGAAPTSTHYDGKIAGLYDLGETLGSGHFAVVKLARHVFTGAKVAVKVVDKTKLDDVSKAHLFQEVRCMKLVQHPNVVRLYEVIDTQTKLYLVLELGDGGDLYDYIMKHEGGLREDLARKYFRQILRAITYCHQLHVVHRDLKPENVVFFEKLGVVKLTDFGFSNKFSPGQKLETFCGSLAYSAPEILLGDSYDAPAVDIWSLGVILYMLVCGQPPFEKANDSETLTMIMDCKYTVPSQISQSCRNLIAAMLVRDPKKRANLEEIASDPWLKEGDEQDTRDYLPLVSRQELAEDDHAFVIQKMINGNIATKEDILQSLDKNKYNHITATYFLLAEIRLRKYREEQVNKDKMLNQRSAKPDDCYQESGSINKGKTNDEKKLTVPISINICPPISSVSEAKSNKRSRKCSIVREEDEDESAHENIGDVSELRVAVTHRESISDGRLNKSVQDKVNSSNQILVPKQPHPKVIPVDTALAQKLNQIDKQSESMSSQCAKNQNANDDENELLSDVTPALRELEVGKLKPLPVSSKNPVLTHRRTKLNKIRTPSCSSSEASDDDTKSRSKKKLNKLVGDTPTRFRMHRRDSHDDSSDSQEQSFPSGSHVHLANIISSNNTSAHSKKDNHTKTKEQNKSEETRKSCNTQKCKKQSKHGLEKHSQSHKISSVVTVRRRIRESQSLDRITEAQEYELRHRNIISDVNPEHRNSLFSLSSFAVAEIKEELDEEAEMHLLDCNDKKNINVNFTEVLKLKTDKNNFCKVDSIGNIDFVLEDKGIAKVIQVTGSKCFVTIKKIRRLGKYFPVVNFS